MTQQRPTARDNATCMNCGGTTWRNGACIACGGSWQHAKSAQTENGYVETPMPEPQNEPNGSIPAQNGPQEGSNPTQGRSNAAYRGEAMGQEGSNVTRRYTNAELATILFAHARNCDLEHCNRLANVFRQAARALRGNEARTAAWYKMSERIRVCRYCGVKLSPIEQLDCSKHVGWIK